MVTPGVPEQGGRLRDLPKVFPRGGQNILAQISEGVPNGLWLSEPPPWPPSCCKRILGSGLPFLGLRAGGWPMAGLCTEADPWFRLGLWGCPCGLGWAPWV